MKKIVWVGVFLLVSSAFLVREAKPFGDNCIVYYGHTAVDFWFGTTNPGTKKTELFRDNILIKQWVQFNGDYKYSDTTDQGLTIGSHTYRADIYKKDIEDNWVLDSTGTATIDTYYFNGDLQNAEPWLTDYGRDAVTWGPETCPVKKVKLKGGNLEVAPGSVVEFVFEYPWLHIDPTTELAAYSVTFVGNGVIYLLGDPTPLTPTLTGCAFQMDKVQFWACTDVRVEYCDFNNTNVEFRDGVTDCGLSFNTATGSSTISDYGYAWPSGVDIIGNEGMGIILADGGISSSLIQGNQVEGYIFIERGSENRIESNLADGINLSDKVSWCTVTGNTVEYISIPGGNNAVTNNDIIDTRTGYYDRYSLHVARTGNYIKDNTITELIPHPDGRVGIYLDGDYWGTQTTSGNTIETNTVYEIVGTGIEVNGKLAFSNLIKKNELLENLSGIVISGSSSNNLENNVFNENLDIGIELTGDSYDNAVAFNHIWGGLSGIVVAQDAHGNGFHENKVEYNDVGIYTVSRNNYIYNNIFRRNLTNALDDGADNTWNHGSAVESPNIVGGPYLGGNYWDDYKGADSDGDGIGEIPYAIFGAQTDSVSYDNLPLIWDDDTPPYLVLSDGDYNGDGRSDITIFRKSSGLWAVRGVTRVYFGGTNDEPVSGDYNGDGTTDISIFRRSSGLWAVRGVSRIYYGASTDTAVPGDYNGDGRCDPGIFRDSMGLWAIRGITRTYFGQPLDKPVPGNYSGAGFASIALFRPSSGLWAIKDLGRIYFGSDEDMPASADYDGNGTTDLAIFRRTMGLWAVAGVTRTYFGGLYDRPAPADYAGASADNIALFREMSGLWAVRQLTRVYFGSSSDIPAAR